MKCINFPKIVTLVNEGIYYGINSGCLKCHKSCLTCKGGESCDILSFLESEGKETSDISVFSIFYTVNFNFDSINYNI